LRKNLTMSAWVVFIIVMALSLIVGGIMLIKKSAKKFNLTPEQLERIKQRNKQLDESDKN